MSNQPVETTQCDQNKVNAMSDHNFDGETENTHKLKEFGKELKLASVRASFIYRLISLYNVSNFTLESIISPLKTCGENEYQILAIEKAFQSTSENKNKSDDNEPDCLITPFTKCLAEIDTKNTDEQYHILATKTVELLNPIMQSICEKDKFDTVSVDQFVEYLKGLKNLPVCGRYRGGIETVDEVVKPSLITFIESLRCQDCGNSENDHIPCTKYIECDQDYVCGTCGMQSVKHAVCGAYEPDESGKYKPDCRNCGRSANSHFEKISVDNGYIVRCNNYQELCYNHCKTCGFNITDHGMSLKYSCLPTKIRQCVSDVSFANTVSLMKITKSIKDLIDDPTLSKVVKKTVLQLYMQFDEIIKLANGAMYVGGAPDAKYFSHH